MEQPTSEYINAYKGHMQQQHPRISARACIRENGAVLLTKHRDHRGFWYILPGGGQRCGETLKECLVREVHEELGITIDVHGMMFIREIIADRHEDKELPKGFHQVEVFFECTLPAGSAPQLGRTPDPYQVGHEWVKLERLKDILFFPNEIADKLTDPSLQGKYLGEIR